MSERIYTPPRYKSQLPPDIMIQTQPKSKISNLMQTFRYSDDIEIRPGRGIGIIIDGACTNNGSKYARGAVGVHFALYSRYNISKKLWPHSYNGKMTNQKAELTAAIVALKKVKELLIRGELNINHLALISDSEYLVKGITSRILRWQRNGWWTVKDTPVANQDEFEQLDGLIDELGKEYDVTIRFWWVSREYTEAADTLARGALSK